MHLHLDCQFGIAGDMLLASLIDAGADREAILGVLSAIPLKDFELSCRRTTRGGVAAMLADVKDLSGAGRGKKARAHKHAHGHSHDHGHPRDHDDQHHHGHDHDPGHDHGHGHDDHSHDHDRAHAPEGGPHRHLADLLGLLDAGAITPRVKERAARVFRIVAEAEAAVHGVPVDQVHFHEISGIDTAVDVIGSCVALDLLGVDSVSASPPAVGSGMIVCEHGIFPVPAPATLEILKSRNVPWRPGGEGERATPTGVALLAGLADSFGAAPEMTVARIGYGAGHREYADAPNLLRAIVGKPSLPGATGSQTRTIIAPAEREPTGELARLPEDSPLLPAGVARLLPGQTAPEGDRVVEFRFSVDDMTPEAVGYLCERCLASGAVEAYAVPAVMKKGRPGHEMTVLARPDQAALVADAIWRDSTTFGMRVGERSRLTLARDFRTVQVLGQKVRVKLGWRGGELIRRQPEYEDCRAAALATGEPLEKIFALAVRMAGEAEQ